jgi:hypothetical protein
MKHVTRWSLGFAAAVAITAAATSAQANQAWTPPAFEPADATWLDAGAALPGEAQARPDRPIAGPAAAAGQDWKTEPSRYLGSPIYGRGLVIAE